MLANLFHSFIILYKRPHVKAASCAGRQRVSLYRTPAALWSHRFRRKLPQAYSCPDGAAGKGGGVSASPVIGHCMAYLSFFGRLGWSPDARTAVGFGVGPWNGPMGTLRRSCGPAGPRFFYFSVCAGRKGAWICQRFPFAAEGCARRRVTAGEFRLLRQATRGLCPRPPRFFEKNRVKLFSPG